MSDVLEGDALLPGQPPPPPPRAGDCGTNDKDTLLPDQDAVLISPTEMGWPSLAGAESKV